MAKVTTIGGRGAGAPTIFDVAKRAGVSHQTVSRVINGDATVRPHMREKVQEAVVALGYRPRAAARALASRRSRALGLVTTGGALHGPMSMGLGFNQAARGAGYHVLMAALDEAEPSSLRDAVESLLAQDVAAIVLVAADRRALDALAALVVPIPVPLLVANGVPGRKGGGIVVAIDQRAGAELAMTHLIGSGHRRIVHIAGLAVSQEAIVRRGTYLERMHEAGLEPLVLQGDWTPESGYAAAMTLEIDAVDALFCSNDQMALGALHAFAERGVRVPEDVAVLGFDDIPEAAHFTPPLTTIRQDFSLLGAHILATVDRVLAGEPAADDLSLQPELVVRASG